MRENARHIAYDTLKNIISNGQYSNLALKEALNRDIQKQDRAFITQLVYGTLEHLITIDYIISLYAKRRVKPAIKNILRLGVYQIYYLNVPDSAACNESVNLAKALGKQGAASFINAVLRNVARNKDKLIWPDRSDLIKYLSIRYSYPEHIVKILINDYGEQTAEGIMSFIPDNELIVRANVTKVTTEELLKLLENDGIEVKRSNLAREALIVKNSNNLINSELYKNGLFSVQSESSMLAAEAVCDAAQQFDIPNVLDACAAPGGKTFYIREHLKDANITALDIHEHRVDLIKSGAKRLDLSNIEKKVQDATIINKKFTNNFDIILIDAPCSGLGVIASKPDIKYNLKESDILSIEKLQESILENCKNYLKKNGIIIYSTCTILKNENERRINAFLNKNTEFTKIDIKELLQIDENHITNGYAQLLNINTGHEGFFIAGMVKNY